MLFVFKLTADFSSSCWLVALSLLVFVNIQQKRKDKLFLKTHFQNYKLIYLIEYSFLSSGLFVCLLIRLQWIPLLILLIGLIGIIHLNPNRKVYTINTKLQRMIPDANFEWKAGVRRTFYLFISVWLLGIIFSFSPIGVPAALFVLSIIISSFYDKSEPFIMLSIYEKNSSRFLLYKLKSNLLLFSIVSLPLILAFVLFHPHIWFIPVVIYFIAIILQTYLIFLKYTFYCVSGNLSPEYSVLSLIGLVFGLILPIFLPIVCILSVYFYFRAQTNLNPYLNDYN
jgi:hypothetical protein